MSGNRYAFRRVVGTSERSKVGMKSESSSADSPKLLYRFVRSIGLAPFVLENDRFRPPSTRDLFHSIGVAVAHLFCLTIAAVLAWLQYEDQPLPLSAKIWAVAQYVACLPATFSILVVIMLSRNKIIRLMNQLCDMSRKLEGLGIEENPGKFFDQTIAITAVANALTITMGAFAYMFQPSWYAFRRIEFGIGCWFNVNTLLIYAQVLSCIKQRFKLLNKRLSEGFLRHRGCEGFAQFQLIRKTEDLHAELSELLQATTRVFALPILLISFQFLCVIVLSGQWMYAFVEFSSSSCSGSRLLSFDTNAISIYLLRMVFVTVQVIIIAHTSAATSQQGNATRATLVDTWNESKPAELQDEFLMFSIQLADKPCTVDVFGIFDLDYSYVYKIFGSAVTYVIVVVQFTAEDTDPYSWKALQGRNDCVTLQ